MDLGQRTIGNMLHDAGYATCYAGKWQLDGAA
jgi:arylsulfatase A-like enzyme